MKILLARHVRGLFFRPRPLLFRTMASVMVFLFGANMVLAPLSFAQVAFLPAAGAMVNMTPKFDPMVVKGIKLYPDNPFKFDFIIDTGDMTLSRDEIKTQGQRLASYFLASLTTPEKEMWVNLSPYEKSRIIPTAFGDTEMGKELLSEDYMLKQIMATALYPERQLGKEFWQRVYNQASQEFGTTNVPVSTFNKVWIVPDEAVVYENAKLNSVFVVQSRLKVMLEQDYLALKKNIVTQQNTVILSEAKDLNKINSLRDSSASPQNDTSSLGSQIIREIVIPALTKEVNEGKNFSGLRQVYQSLILAAWYKKNLKDNVLAKGYVNRNKTLGVDTQDKQITEKIYQQYLRAYRKGVYNYIKEEIDPATQQMIPRKYFSGGVNYTNMVADIAMASPAQVSAFDASMSASVRRGVLYTLGAVFLAIGLPTGAHAAGLETPIGNQGPYAAYLQINPQGTFSGYQREVSNGSLQVRLPDGRVASLSNFNPRMISGGSVLVETANVNPDSLTTVAPPGVAPATTLTTAAPIAVPAAASVPIVLTIKSGEVAQSLLAQKIIEVSEAAGGNVSSKDANFKAFNLIKNHQATLTDAQGQVLKNPNQYNAGDHIIFNLDALGLPSVVQQPSAGAGGPGSPGGSPPVEQPSAAPPIPENQPIAESASGIPVEQPSAPVSPVEAQAGQPSLIDQLEIAIVNRDKLLNDIQNAKEALDAAREKWQNASDQVQNQKEYVKLAQQGLDIAKNNDRWYLRIIGGSEEAKAAILEAQTKLDSVNRDFEGFQGVQVQADHELKLAQETDDRLNEKVIAANKAVEDLKQAKAAMEKMRLLVQTAIENTRHAVEIAVDKLDTFVQTIRAKQLIQAEELIEIMAKIKTNTGQIQKAFSKIPSAPRALKAAQQRLAAAQKRAMQFLGTNQGNNISREQLEQNYLAPYYAALNDFYRILSLHNTSNDLNYRHQEFLALLYRVPLSYRILPALADAEKAEKGQYIDFVSLFKEFFQKESPLPDDLRQRLGEYNKNLVHYSRMINIGLLLANTEESATNFENSFANLKVIFPDSQTPELIKIMEGIRSNSGAIIRIARSALKTGKISDEDFNNLTLQQISFQKDEKGFKNLYSGYKSSPITVAPGKNFDSHVVDNLTAAVHAGEKEFQKKYPGAKFWATDGRSTSTVHAENSDHKPRQGIQSDAYIDEHGQKQYAGAAYDLRITRGGVNITFEPGVLQYAVDIFSHMKGVWPEPADQSIDHLHLSWQGDTEYYLDLPKPYKVTTLDATVQLSTLQQLASLDNSMSVKQAAPTGGIDLEKLILNTKGGGVRTAFSDPRILQMLLEAKGLFPQIQSIELMTVPMVEMLLGFNAQANNAS